MTTSTHQVVTGGPCRFVQHPGYAAAIVLAVASPLLLGSYWSVALTVPIGVCFSGGSS